MISNNSGYIINPLNIRTFILTNRQLFLTLHRILCTERGLLKLSLLNLFSLMKNRHSKNSWKISPLKLFVLVFAIGFLIFGIYQTAIHGFNHAYWIFIYSIILFIVYGFIINRKKSDTNGK